VNLFEARVDTVLADRVRLAAADSFTIETTSGAALQPGQDASFAVRPEKVRIAHYAPTDTAVNAVRGEVWDIAYFGDSSLYNVRLPSGKIVRASAMNAARTVERPITWEDAVWLSWAPDAGVVLTK
jgi:putrescine transport system ATP-binding protein